MRITLARARLLLRKRPSCRPFLKQGHAAKKSVGSVHVYILNPEGNLIDSMHVAEAAKTKQLTTLLEKTVADLKVRPGAPVVKPRPQSSRPECDTDSLVLHLTSRSIDGRGAWTDFPVENWIILSAAEQRLLLPENAARVGFSWTPDAEVLKKLLTHFYPATENNDVSKNRFEQLSTSATLTEIGNNSARVRLNGRFRFTHSFYHRDDGKAVEGEVVGFIDFLPSERKVSRLLMTTRDASYNGGKFAIALQSVQP